MKKQVLLIFLCLFTFAGIAQQADKIAGTWWNDKRTSKIQIEKKNEKYIGTIIFMSPEKYKNGQPPKDDKNPDVSLRNRSLVGLQILHNFEFDEKKKEWKNGKIYDPESGNTYDCYAWLQSDDLLKLKGFVAGIRLLGRSSEWYRAE